MGSNTDGKLGVGERNMKQSNVPCLVEGLMNITKVSCGMSHTLAVNNRGELYSWGQGFYGALGMNDSKTYDRPMKNSRLHFEKVVDVAAGSRHSLFLTANNRVYACGEAKSGQLGLGSLTQDKILKPTVIAALSEMNIGQISCGKFHSLFLTQHGEVYATGGNSFGQLGLGNKTNQNIPMKVTEIQDVHSLSAWHFSAAITKSNQLYVWGTGIFGEYLTPKLIPSDKKYVSVQVGGSFAVLIDKNNRSFVWGANTNGELGVGDTQPRTVPTQLQSIEDKPVFHVGVGNAFAFALGQKLVNNENYQTYLTEEPITIQTIQEDSPPKYQPQRDKVMTPTEQHHGARYSFHDQFEHKNLSNNKSYNNLHTPQHQLPHKDQQMQTLQEENRKLQKEILNGKQQESKMKLELEIVRKNELALKSRVSEMEVKMKEAQMIKDENAKLRSDVDDLSAKIALMQRANQYYHHKNSSANTTTIDYNSPGMVTIDAKIHRLEEEFGSPTTIAHDLTTLKFEDLQEGRKDNYNPVWRLQVTDDKNLVKYDGKFMDRNEPTAHKPKVIDFGQRYRFEEPQLQDYKAINFPEQKPAYHKPVYEQPSYERPSFDKPMEKQVYEQAKFDRVHEREALKSFDRQPTFDNNIPAAGKEFTFANRQLQYNPSGKQLLSDDRKYKKDNRLYDFENRNDYEDARAKNEFGRELEYKNHYEPIGIYAKKENEPYVPRNRSDVENQRPVTAAKDYEPVDYRQRAQPSYDVYQRKEVDNKAPGQPLAAKKMDHQEDDSKFKINLQPIAQTNEQYLKPPGAAPVQPSAGVSRIDEIRQKLDRFKQQREESGQAIKHLGRDPLKL